MRHDAVDVLNCAVPCNFVTLLLLYMLPAALATGHVNPHAYRFSFNFSVMLGGKMHVYAARIPMSISTAARLARSIHSALLIFTQVNSDAHARVFALNHQKKKKKINPVEE